MNQEGKNTVVGEVTESFNNSVATFIVGYEGINAGDISSLRRNLVKAGSKFRVVKNRLIQRALKGTAGEGFDPHLHGANAIVLSNSDPVSPAKVLKDFAKTNDKLKIKAGLVEGSVIDHIGVDALASLPSKQELQAKLLALINAPATRLLQTVNAPASSLVRLLSAYEKKLEEGK